MDTNNCFHCGLDIVKKDEILYDSKNFCCKGCQMVYAIFSENDLMSYYDFENTPGAKPSGDSKYIFLENEKIVEKLLDFNEGDTQIVSLQIPHIHCSSCIWILENLHRLQAHVVSSQVNFHQKKVRITYNSAQTSLKEIALLLCAIGYEPYISLDDYDVVQTKTDRSLTYKLGVAFFCFGNIMLLSFPEYFEVNEFWLDQYKGFFRWLIFLLALPSFFYSASGYYVAAWKSIRAKMLNIEIPIALGIVVMFVRSVVDMVFDHGPGFFDSMTGLVFFMLLGKMFQIKTYSFLSFERDYKSYFPVAVTKVNPDGSTESIPIYEIQRGDRLYIRNQELVPADSILISENAAIDYSFVTGEAVAVAKKSGDKIFAGGKQLGNIIEMEVLQSVSQSYLTQLWSNEVFTKKSAEEYKTITDTISHYFTPALLLVAFAGFGYWIFIDTTTAFNVFTAVLIVACPCALALTAPFTLGNILRILGRQKCYLKNAQVIEQLAKIDTIVFDKTGTITTSKTAQIDYKGQPFSAAENAALKNVLSGSNHPLSRMLHDFLPESQRMAVDFFSEIPGKGIEATINEVLFQIGSADFLGIKPATNSLKTTVHIAINHNYFGYFIFNNDYRKGLRELFSDLDRNYDIKVLSGDNEGERGVLEQLLPAQTQMIFNQKPEQKLEFIKTLQHAGKNVLMVGDGLNDAGALAQSNVGISIAENVNVFSPACDAILDAANFSKINKFLKLSRKAIVVIKMSFILSLLYNVVGLTFAVSGNLLPLVAAIIMPLSTVTIISFVTLMSNFYTRKLGLLATDAQP